MNSSNKNRPEQSAIDLESVYGLVEKPKHSIVSSEKKTSFQAWHHPRKQYVRIQQWCSSVQKLIKEVGLSGNGADFAYLTLPGNELLDIRELHGVCRRAGVKLRYMGFNSVAPKTAEQAELHLSRSEVSFLENISELSGILEHRFEGIANEKAAAYVKVREKAPFNAINLDLCDSVAARGLGHSKGSYLDALRVLIDLQNQSTKPWLLFLTTRAAPDQVAPENAGGFQSAINDNSAKSAAFKLELAKLLALSAEDLEARLGEMWGEENEKFPLLFAIGLGKWLLHLTASSSPPRELKLESICGYRVSSEWPDMLSFVFKCEAVGGDVEDKHGLTKARKQKVAYSETEAARRYIKGIAAMIDLDQVLLQDPVLSAKLIEQGCNLLESARYAPDAYRSWAQEKIAAMQLSSAS